MNFKLFILLQFFEKSYQVLVTEEGVSNDSHPQPVEDHVDSLNKAEESLSDEILQLLEAEYGDVTVESQVIETGDNMPVYEVDGDGIYSSTLEPIDGTEKSYQVDQQLPSVESTSDVSENPLASNTESNTEGSLTKDAPSHIKEHENFPNGDEINKTTEVLCEEKRPLPTKNWTSIPPISRTNFAIFVGCVITVILIHWISKKEPCQKLIKIILEKKVELSMKIFMPLFLGILILYMKMWIVHPYPYTTFIIIFLECFLMTKHLCEEHLFPIFNVNPKANNSVESCIQNLFHASFSSLIPLSEDSLSLLALSAVHTISILYGYLSPILK